MATWQTFHRTIRCSGLRHQNFKISRIRHWLHLTPRWGTTSASFASLVYKMSHEEFLVEDVSNEKLSCDIRRRRIEEKGRRRFNWKAVIVIPTNQPTNQATKPSMLFSFGVGKKIFELSVVAGINFCSGFEGLDEKKCQLFQKKKLGEFKIGSIFSNPGKRKELGNFFHLRFEQQIEQRYLKKGGTAVIMVLWLT